MLGSSATRVRSGKLGDFESAAIVGFVELLELLLLLSLSLLEPAFELLCQVHMLVPPLLFTATPGGLVYRVRARAAYRASSTRSTCGTGRLVA